MKRIGCVLLVAIVFAGMGASQKTAESVPVYAIQKPTIIAFFTQMTDKELENDPGSNEALSDFQLYNGEVHDPLLKAGIEFREADAHSFKIRVGKRIQTFRTGKIGIGYYFIAPGKKPHVENGVMTDTDILDVARKYFGIAIPR